MIFELKAVGDYSYIYYTCWLDPATMKILAFPDLIVVKAYAKLPKGSVLEPEGLYEIEFDGYMN